MSSKNKLHIISPADIIDLYHDMKEIISEHGINMLNNENLLTCTQFVELCHQYIPHAITDLSPYEYKMIQKNKPRMSVDPLYNSESYNNYISNNKTNKDDWQLVK